MNTFRFTYNWNNKLDCHAFTTIRMYNPTVHYAGNKVKIELKGEDKGMATIMEVRRFLLADMSAFVSYLDTGYSIEECKQIFLKMYQKVDFRTYKLALILILKDKPAKE